MRASIDRIHEAIKAHTNLSLETGDWAPTPNKALGDFSVPCFKLAKALGKAPPVVATELAAALASQLSTLGFSEVRAVGPYLNVFQNVETLYASIKDKLDQNPEKFGSLELGRGKTVVIDFSSPNVAKEIGLHHLRSTAIGNSLARIFKFQGYRVERINYLGDWGTSFGKLIEAFKLESKELGGDAPVEKKLREEGLPYMLDLYVRYNRAEKENPELAANAKAAFRHLEEGRSEYRRIWQLFRGTSIEEIKKLYSRLDVDFDHYDGESLYEKKLDAAVDEVSSKVGTYVSDGALVCDLPGHKIPVLLKKNDGASLYITRDIVAAEDRFNRFKYDVSLYVVSIQQKLHFQQLFDLLKQLGKPFADRCEHISYGMLSFGSKTMKSREGNMIVLHDALDEGKKKALEIIREKNPELVGAEAVAEMVGIGAFIFTDLSQNRNHDIRFDWDKALSFEGDTSGVIQYTHARCTSLLERTNVHRKTLATPDAKPIAELLGHEAVRGLLLAWDGFDLSAEKALVHRDPAQIASATLDIAKAFNQLYHKVRFLDVSSANEVDLLMMLTSNTQRLLKQGLGLLGIKAPERM
ncbi:MAG: arginine--tRNA ligase [Bdellovibrionota bacterium]